MNVSVTITGVATTLRDLRTATAGAETLNKLRGVVGTNVHYARYQEYGTRFMAGRFFLLRAMAPVKPHLFAQALAEAVWKGPSEVRRVFNVTLFGILARAQVGAPVDTGQLRSSLYSKSETR
ncbi:MAG TPA: hypothetical protein VNM48_16530 [Chloroflexota bacterium]|nr:hypothetical protein [Chloroflexota bacterium]